MEGMTKEEFIAETEKMLREQDFMKTADPESAEAMIPVLRYLTGQLYTEIEKATSLVCRKLHQTLADQSKEYAQAGRHEIAWELLAVANTILEHGEAK